METTNNPFLLQQFHQGQKTNCNSDNMFQSHYVQGGSSVPAMSMSESAVTNNPSYTLNSITTKSIVDDAQQHHLKRRREVSVVSEFSDDDMEVDINSVEEEAAFYRQTKRQRNGGTYNLPVLCEETNIDEDREEMKDPNSMAWWRQKPKPNRPIPTPKSITQDDSVCFVCLHPISNTSETTTTYTQTTQHQVKTKSLLSYFPSKSSKPNQLKGREEVSVELAQCQNSYSCDYCEHTVCHHCTRQCESCMGKFCNLCSNVNFEGPSERMLCIDCEQYDDEAMKNRCSQSDVSMDMS